MQAKTIVALYDDLSSAQQVLTELQTAGLRNDFTMMGAENAALSTAHDGSDWRHASALGGTSLHGRGTRVDALQRLGVPKGDAEIFAEGVRRGGVLVIGRVEDARCDEALAVIERHSPIDIHERGESYRSTGWTGYDSMGEDYDETRALEERTRYRGTTSGTMAGAGLTGSTGLSGVGTDRTTTDMTTDADLTAGTIGSGVGSGVGSGLGAAAQGLRNVNTGEEERIPVVEEQLNVGKREVTRGGVRVRSYVVETPVEEHVRLRDETVTVERRPVDLAAGDLPADAFRERTIEVTETDEEAVVEKAARVREEVVIRKDVEVREQAISDTVRRTEVEIEDDRTADRPLDRGVADRDVTDRSVTDRIVNPDRDRSGV